MKKTIIIILTLLMNLGLSAQEKKLASDVPSKIDAPKPVKVRKMKGAEDKVTAKMVMEDTLTNEYLDTLNLKRKLDINDYSMIGVHYGVGLSQVMWNPSQKQDMVFMPYNIGVTYTKYGKMFGYMPYFGFQAGILYTQEGYQFEYNEEKDYTYKIEGAEKAVIDVIEVPVMAHMHIDFWNMKVTANIGCYAGYRLAIERFAGKTGHVKDELIHSFKDTDRRMDYGIKGGLGFGFVFDPIEIHFQAMYKHSLSSLYEPDHYSEYYYRFAYPSNIIISAGIHFQLTKRTGQTKAELKKMAKEMVYGNTGSKGR
ncbi:MAG: PorT family protein [Bacteroidales bacterium]|nr:PorT family protein [Bacteroidales bacterium]